MEGRIKWFEPARGFGFIDCGGPKDFYFPRTEFHGETPAVGLAVTFEPLDGHRARNVCPAEDPAVYSVAGFLHAMSAALATRHPEVTVEGEVASVRPYGSMLFFELKEEGARLSCLIRSDLVPDLEEGARVRVVGAPGVSVKNGDVRLRARAVEFAGEGALRRAVEALRRRLEEEGLFAPARKRRLPAYPTAVGLVTAAGCDGDTDFRTKLAQRWPSATIYLAHVPVQGASAPEQIAGAMRYLNEAGLPLDVVAIVRGGGSADDLQAFNTERVVRAIVASRVPVITGVGHENDTTLADLAADVRAMTPTDAALRVAPDRARLARVLGDLNGRIAERMLMQIHAVSRRLVRDAALMERAFAAPGERLRADEAAIVRGMQHLLDGSRDLLRRHESSVRRQQQRQLSDAATRVETLANLVDALAPQSVLRRGFAIVSGDAGVIRSSKALQVRDTVRIRFDDGSVGARVEEV